MSAARKSVAVLVIISSLLAISGCKAKAIKEMGEGLVETFPGLKSLWEPSVESEQVTSAFLEPYVASVSARAAARLAREETVEGQEGAQAVIMSPYVARYDTTLSVDSGQFTGTTEENFAKTCGGWDWSVNMELLMPVGELQARQMMKLRIRTSEDFSTSDHHMELETAVYTGQDAKDETSREIQHTRFNQSDSNKEILSKVEEGINIVDLPVTVLTDIQSWSLLIENINNGVHDFTYFLADPEAPGLATKEHVVVIATPKGDVMRYQVNSKSFSLIDGSWVETARSVDVVNEYGVIEQSTLIFNGMSLESSVIEWDFGAVEACNLAGGV